MLLQLQKIHNATLGKNCRAVLIYDAFHSLYLESQILVMHDDNDKIYTPQPLLLTPLQ